jgi:hypothetical protein
VIGPANEHRLSERNTNDFNEFERRNFVTELEKEKPTQFLTLYFHSIVLTLGIRGLSTHQAKNAAEMDLS